MVAEFLHAYSPLLVPAGGVPLPAEQILPALAGSRPQHKVLLDAVTMMLRVLLNDQTAEVSSCARCRDNMCVCAKLKQTILFRHYAQYDMLTDRAAGADGAVQRSGCVVLALTPVQLMHGVLSIHRSPHITSLLWRPKAQIIIIIITIVDRLDVGPAALLSGAAAEWRVAVCRRLCVP